MRELELTSYPWQSSSVYAALLDAHGVVVRANPAMRAGVGEDLSDTEFTLLLRPEQRAAFMRLLAETGDEWSSAIYALQDGEGGPAEDRRLWVRRTEPDLIELIAEPAWQDQTRLVEQVLQLNDDLITTQRSLSRRQRELEQAQADAAGAALRVRELESVVLAGLAHTDPDRALQELLETAQELLPGERADLLLVDESVESLVLRARAGTSDLIDPEPQIKLGTGILGGIAATGDSRLVDDLASVTTKPGVRGSLIGVPLRVEGRVAGVLAVRAEERARFEHSHLLLLEVFAERVALAVGHAQLRERERGMAEILQRTLLPQRLPDVAGIELCAHYSGRGASVGGDFYDAIALPDGRVAVTIGDVSGKGLRAAAAMAHLRAAIHAFVIDCCEPGEVLLRLGRLAEADGIFATAALLVIDPHSGHVVVANAGHPPPLLVDAGSASFLELAGSRSPLLGLSVQSRGQAATELPAGAGVLLFTDGLVESTRDLDAGLERLQAEAAGCSEGPLQDLCDHLLATLSPTGRYRDDVTLLAARWVGLAQTGLSHRQAA